MKELEIFRFYRKTGFDWQLVCLPELPSLSVALSISRLLSILCNCDIMLMDCCQRSYIITLDMSKALRFPYIVSLLLCSLTSVNLEVYNSAYDYYDVEKEEDVPINQI